MSEKPLSKWGRKFWEDYGERVGVTVLYGVLSILAVALDEWNWKLVWAALILPTLFAVVKGLLANLLGSSNAPSASMIDVTSGGKADTIDRDHRLF